MPNFSCYDCLTKHLSYAYSYAQEVINGHSAGGNPDHRIDFSGELLQAERHAIVIDYTFALKIRRLRKTLQGQRWKPLQDDITKIRTMWYHSYSLNVEDFKKIEKEDPDLFYEINLASVKYEKLQTDEEQTVECKCKARQKEETPKTDNTLFATPTAVLYVSNNPDTQKLEQIKKNLADVQAIAIVPKSFESDPISFLDNNEEDFKKIEDYLLCVWPEEAEMIRRTNAMAIPSVLKEEQRGNTDKETEKTIYDFERLPVQVSVQMIREIFRNKKEGYLDFYSIIRNFDGSFKFDNTNKIVVHDRSKIELRTLFVVNNKE